MNHTVRQKFSLPRSRAQQGYFALLAVVLILVMGLMGSVIVNLFATRAQTSANQLGGLRAFYLAESGLEIASRLLTTSTFTGTGARVVCSALTGTSTVTNASLLNGTFTLSAVGTPVVAVTTLSSALTFTGSTIAVTSFTNFAGNGRLHVEDELIDYEAVSGTNFINVTRGAGGSRVRSHAVGAPVSQYQCTVDSKAGIPSIAAPKYQRNVQAQVQLQDGWLVGDKQSNNFSLMRWNYPAGVDWNNSSLAGGSSASNLEGVSMLSNAFGFAVGGAVGTNFTFLRWNGTAWVLNAQAGACSNQHLLAVSLVSNQQGFAVGSRYRPACASSGNYRYTILRWNGSNWVALTPSVAPTIPADASTNQNLNAVHVIDTNGDGLGNIGFAVGNAGHILTYNGTSWTRATSPTTQHLKGVYVVSASEAWAVGVNGVILKYTGSWSLFTSPVSTDINAISMLDTDNDGLANFGVAAGSSGRLFIYNGTSWTFTDFGNTNFLAVGIFSPDDAWAAGASGSAYHWDGTVWSNIGTGTNNQINAISLVLPGSNPVTNWRQIFR
ncbi:MAG: hypothetical protein H0W64_08350 [Gammaproteobacteria bacterium]|nr:hypothetical protein [Gammaproteobacteria bacterium]